MKSRHYNSGTADRRFRQNCIHPSYVNLAKVALAKAMVMNNEQDIDLELLYSYEAKNKFKLIDGRMRRYIGEILLNIDDQHTSDAEG